MCEIMVHPSELSSNMNDSLLQKYSYEIQSNCIKRILYIYPHYTNNYIDKNGYIILCIQCIVEYIYYFIGELLLIDSYVYTSFGTLTSLYNHIKILIPDMISSTHKEQLIEIVDINIKHQYLCIGTCI